jgi:hypothetical protein
MNSQRIKLGSFLALLLTVAVFDSASFSAQSSRKRKAALTDTYRGLQVSVTSDLETYKQNDTVSLEFRLKNVGNEPITIYKRFGWGWSSSFFLAVNDSTGQTIQPSFLEDHLPYPYFPKEDFTVLQSEEFTKLEREIDLKGYGVKKPGVYFVTVWYRSPVPIRFAPDGLKIWPMEYGRLEAKRVRFTVMK